MQSADELPTSDIVKLFQSQQQLFVETLKETLRPQLQSQQHQQQQQHERTDFLSDAGNEVDLTNVDNSDSSSNNNSKRPARLVRILKHKRNQNLVDSTNNDDSRVRATSSEIHSSARSNSGLGSSSRTTDFNEEENSEELSRPLYK